MSRVRALWQRRLLRRTTVVLVVLALVLVGGSNYATSHLTDNVSVTAQSWDQGQQVFATVIHVSARARRVREIFDAAQLLQDSGAGIDCALPATQTYVYEFVFTWRGITTESVNWALFNCSFIRITRWGNPFTQTYAGLSRSQYDELVRLTGIPVNPRY